MAAYGTGPGGVPFHRFGDGPGTLVIFPGVMDALGWNRPNPLTRELLARHYFRHVRGYDVWVSSRAPGLSSGEGVEEMASRYERLLESCGGGHVLGFTLGGAIGVSLSRRRPDLVDSLILVACGTRLGNRGRSIVRKWRSLARSERWRALHVDYARRMYTGLYRGVMPVLYRLFSPLLPRPRYPFDVVQSCEALLEYDGQGQLEGIDAPTLVVADTDGPLFPTDLQRDAARRCERGYVATMDGSHAVYNQSRRAFAAVVTQFLDEQHTD